MVIVQSGKIPDSGGGGKPANLKGICWGNSVLGQDLSEREVPVTTGAVFRARWLPGTWGENMTIMDLDSKSSDTVLERLALDWLDGDHQRSEERRVGKACGGSCRAWWSPDL